MLRMRSFHTLCALALIGLIFSCILVGNIMSGMDVMLGGFLVASIAVGTLELWAPIKAASRAVFAAFWRSRFAAFALAAYTTSMNTLRRLFGGSWRQDVRSAPAHSWRACPST